MFRDSFRFDVFLVALLALFIGTQGVAQPRRGFIGDQSGSDPVQAGGAKRGSYGAYGEWEYCAREGDRCTADGWAVVRYGARGRYVYREVNFATLDCDNRMFSDPAPGTKKSCELRYFDHGGHGGGYPDDHWDSDGWQRCAREGENCRFGGAFATVRYGADGRFYERQVRGGSVFCGNETFGDPAPRSRKYCDVLVTHGQPGYGGGQPGYDDGYYGGGDYQWGGQWTYCAREGRSCQLPTSATVRYGANGRYTFRRLPRGAHSCDNRTFGDPAPGDKKACDYQTDGGFGGSDWGGGHWVYCARENDYCEFRGTRNVRYSAEDGRHIVRRFRDGVECSNRAFGQDPARREKKFCSFEESW